MVKPIEKIGENKNIDLEKMKEIRKITDLPEMTKVKLGATFDNHMTSTPELFVTCLDLSNIILDKSRWWIGITDAPVKSICTQSEHIIYIKHNSNIKVARGRLVDLQKLSFHCFADSFITEWVFTRLGLQTTALFIYPGKSNLFVRLQIFLHAGCSFLPPEELTPHAKNYECGY